VREAGAVEVVEEGEGEGGVVVERVEGLKDVEGGWV